MSKAEKMKKTAYMLEKRSNMVLEQARMDGTITPAQEKLVELMKDEAFVQKLLNCASAEAVKELFDQNDIDIPMEEIQSMLVMVGALVQKLEENDGELSEQELEMVAGGWSWGGFIAGAVSCLVFALVVVGLAALEGATFGAATPLAVAGCTAFGGVLGGVLWFD